MTERRQPDVILVDNFYSDVDEVRAQALTLDFNEKGNYPGMRTEKFPWDMSGIKTYLEGILGIEITNSSWEGGGYNGSFQIVSADPAAFGGPKVDSPTGTWIHTDELSEYSCVVYLTPNAPPRTGTSLFRHKETGLIRGADMNTGLEINPEGTEYENWELIDDIGNVYNRAIIFRGDYWHAASGYFGKTKEDSRLFQTFFFSGKYSDFERVHDITYDE